MDDKIIAFISQYISLTEQEIEAIKEQNLFKFYPKDTVLLSKGERSKSCYFVIKGCVRRYHLVDGEEKTTEFYTENQTINPVSYLKDEPSEYYLKCMEDCTLSLGSEEKNRELLEKVPRLGQMIAKMSIEMVAENQVQMDDFKNLKPEMRYQKLMELRPDLIQRVPLQHIATYLGITPVSLSRLRKRIMEKA